MEITPTLFAIFIFCTIFVVILLFLIFFIILSSVNGDKMTDNMKESWVKVGKIFQDTYLFFYHFFIDLLHSIGDLISSSGNVSTQGIKYIADFFNAIFQDIGRLFKGVTNANPSSSPAPPSSSIDKVIQNAPLSTTTAPLPASSASTTASTEQKWCFIGMEDSAAKNVCVPLKPNQSCASNRIYSSQNSCIQNDP
jgi:hypothetical protein